MSKAISIRVQPQTGRQAGGQRRHDLRDPAHVPDYVDQSRTHQNSVIIEPPDPATVRAEIAEHRRQAGQQKLRADARTTIGGIITFGKDAQPVIEALPREEQEALFLRVAQRMAKEAERPLLGLVVHRDESATHAHFTLRGYKLENGKEVAPRFSRADLQRIQDAAAHEVAHLGIERGVSRATREARGDDRAKVVHRSVRELHDALPREIETAQARKLAIDEEVAASQARKLAIEQEVAALEAKRADNERLAEKARQALEDGNGREMALRKRLAVYEERVRKAEEQIKAFSGQAMAPQPPAARQFEVVTKSGGLLKRPETDYMDLVNRAEVQDWSKKIKDWARTTWAARNIEKEQDLNDREAELGPAQKLQKENTELRDENTRLKTERQVIGMHVGHMLGVENASMNRGKIVDAIVKTADLQKFRDLLGQQKSIQR